MGGHRLSLNHTNTSVLTRKFSHVPAIRTAPIIQAVYHHPLLITLSQGFHLSLYNLTGHHCAHPDPVVVHVLSADVARPLRSLSDGVQVGPGARDTGVPRAPERWRN
jgi:hypothetical protein